MPGAAKERKVAIEAESPFGVKKDLFEAATKIKNQLDLLQKRLEKMESHREQVSDSVYIKVKTDYETQIDEVRGNFKEKCREIEAELNHLYHAQKEQEAELSKHEEILEEAKFRHTLGEYTEKKFKDVEKEQNKAIKEFKGVLGVIKGSIEQYENILGHSYEPKPVKAEEKDEDKEVIEDISLVEESNTADVAGESAEFTPATTAAQEAAEASKTAPKEKPVKDESVTDAKVPKVPKEEAALEAELDEELDSLLQTEGDYFSQEPEKSEEEVPAKPKHEAQGEFTDKVPASASPPPAVSKTKPDDDSISSILRDIPIEEEGAAPSEESTDTGEVTGAKVPGEFPEASLLLLEGDLDEPEYILGENTSIGRSPSNDLVLKESKVSRQHAAIHFRDGHFVIVDLKSSNGVLVNDQKVEEHYLQDGDELRIGSFKFQFNIL